MTQPNPLLTTALGAVRNLIKPVNYRRSDTSASSVADDGLASLNNDRHFPAAAGVLEHLLQLLGVFLDVKIDRLVAIG